MGVLHTDGDLLLELLRRFHVFAIGLRNSVCRVEDCVNLALCLRQRLLQVSLLLRIQRVVRSLLLVADCHNVAH